MNWKETLQKLSHVHPEYIGEVACQLLEKYADTSLSPLGNVYGVIDGSSSYTVLLDAHMDEICLLVTGVDDLGFIHIDTCGGIDRRVLAGSEVTVWGEKPLYGVFSVVPPHLKKSNDKQLLSVSEMGIDIGYSARQARELVHPGDRVTFRSSVMELQQGCLSGKSLDNRAGVAILLRLCELIAKSDNPLPVRVIMQFSQMEETGTGYAGAVTGANHWQPNEAIVVDAGFATCRGGVYATPGRFESGVMVGVSPVLSRQITCRLQETAKENNIPYTLDVYGGRTGTNADRIITTGQGVPTGLASYPLQNMHMPIEMINERNLEQCAKLLYAYLMKGGMHHA